MKAAWYERQGSPDDVLQIGDMPDPSPGHGEVRVSVRASGINPGDVKKRSDAFGVGMPYPRVIPHSDGAGIIDAVGPGVAGVEVGDRVWCFGAQSYRAHGTAAEYVVVPAELTAPLPDIASFETGACLGIPGITAHRGVHVSGPPEGRTLLVQGGAGAVGACAVSIARASGATVVATVRHAHQVPLVEAAGAHHAVCTEGLGDQEVVGEILGLCPDGVDHIVEVAFHANAAMDEAVLRQGGSIATYATVDPEPRIPFWPLVFKNVSIHFLGSDDFPMEARRAGAQQLSQMLASGWDGPSVGPLFSLDDIASAHAAVESGRAAGRVLLSW